MPHRPARSPPSTPAPPRRLAHRLLAHHLLASPPRHPAAAPPRRLALPLLALAACVEVTATTHVRDLPHPDRSRVPVPVRLLERPDFALTWAQTGADLEVLVEAHPRCRDRLDVPVLRETRTLRRADPALYAEYGIAALFAGAAAYAYSRPHAFSAPLITPDGEIVRAPEPGYTAAALFTAVAALALTSAIRDSVRARDTVEYADALVSRDLGPAPCDPGAPRPWAARDLELVLGPTRLPATTDSAGRARFVLPSDPAHAALPPGTLLPAALRLAPDRALALTLAVPYEATLRQPHRGHTAPPPPLPHSAPASPTAP